MNKLAVFVEGYTEMVFVEKLIKEIAVKNSVSIDLKRVIGGGKSGARRTFRSLRNSVPNTGQNYYIMIVDSGGDRNVKSRILEEHENLTNAGYTKIIGLRDVRPDFIFSEVPRLEAGLRSRIKTSLIPVEFILAIMEIEAWFLAEASHFLVIDPAITVQAILAALHFDPSFDDMEQRLTPTADLCDCYAIGGKTYRKREAQFTVDALDVTTMYCWPETKFRYLNQLRISIESFLQT